MYVEEYDFGVTEDGNKVKAITITNSDLMEITLISRGATLKSCKIKNREGILEECCLGFNSLKKYEEHKSYYGATIGRVANRVGGALVHIGGVDYPLYKNDGSNSIHGGKVGFDKVIWSYRVVEESFKISVEFNYLSVDGEEGFPGNLNTRVTYSLTSDNRLIIDYHGTTDRVTAVNLTNHSYWNLNGFKESIYKHKLQISANSYLPTDSNNLPTGEYKSVTGTPYDYRKLKELMEGLNKTGGYDHNFNLSSNKQIEPNNRIYMEDPVSGRSMEILTTEPGVQLYTGFDDHKFFCLETQMLPDAVNHSKFPSILLQPGKEYRQTTIHKFLVK